MVRLHGGGETLVARLGPGVGGVVLVRLFLVQVDPLFLISVVELSTACHFLKRGNHSLILLDSHSLVNKTIIAESVLRGQLIELVPIRPKPCSPSPRIVKV